ncbi:MAG: 50S ribosomal protein L15 [Candidatus Calescibacterium sp.]|nr:50S ribosomal protein L15 [Candidatus Calescibacterium sp.]MCX7972372.1 50S ribosomal protein L15 [bacterium]MDW8195737.1 50S ribosomal protein L15 [Candidatus Calescibacterium sp.]
MKVHQLKPFPGSKHKRKRVGRGLGSGHGVTATRGTKGQKARSGGAKSPWFEGGQNPLYLRIPSKGFTNIFRKEYQTVKLEDLNIFEDKSVVKPEDLLEKGLIKTINQEVKILGNGNLTKTLEIHAHKITRRALEKLKKNNSVFKKLPPLRKKFKKVKKQKK